MAAISLYFETLLPTPYSLLLIAVLGSVRYSFSQLPPPRLLSAQIHSLAPQIMPSGPLREVGAGGGNGAF